jgi:hypothetical protein
MRVPYDRLASIHGWVVWLGHPPVPDGLVLLPAPEILLWNAPETAVATGMLVAADYAIRRGATDEGTARAVLDRECPVVFVVPDAIRGAGAEVLADAESTGMPVVRLHTETTTELAGLVPSFARRRTAHDVSLGRPHDPALSFQIRVPSLTIGDNAVSSFVVHDEPEGDGVRVSGVLGPQFAMEVGVSAPGLKPDAMPRVERLVATIPSFLDGVTSYLENDALEIGWQEGREPTPEIIGEVVRVWLETLLDATMVDVRMAFAPSGSTTPELTELHRRAAHFRRSRETAATGIPRTASDDERRRGAIF